MTVSFTSIDVLNLCKKLNVSNDYRTVTILTEELFPEEYSRYAANHKGPACYLLKDGDSVLYVGESGHICGRLCTHILGMCQEKTQDLLYVALRNAHDAGTLSMCVIESSPNKVQRLEHERELTEKYSSPFLFNVENNPSPSRQRFFGNTCFVLGVDKAQDAEKIALERYQDIRMKLQEYEDRLAEEREADIDTLRKKAFWPFISPHFNGRAFTCPHCGVGQLKRIYAHFDFCKEAPWANLSQAPDEVVSRLSAWRELEKSPGRRKWFSS